MKLSVVDGTFSRIYETTYRKTAAYLTARCRSLLDVEDLLQETYLTVYRILADRGEEVFENEEAYVLCVAKSRLVDWYRKSGKTLSTINGKELEEGEGWLNVVPDGGSSPEELAEYKEAAAAVQSFVAGKDQMLQQAFYLHYSFGLSFPEIGRLQNRNESSVRSSVFRLTQELRDRFERSLL